MVSVGEAVPADGGDAVAARVGMVNGLVGAGALVDMAWRDVFEQVPRHVFVPAFFEPSAQHPGRWRAVSEAGDRAAWLRAVYRDAELVTQLDGFRDPGATQQQDEVAGVATASSTAPGVLARMLSALDVRDRHRALVVGTGTGYSTALVVARLARYLVAAIEYEAVLTARARAALESVDLRPVLFPGDAGTMNVGRDDSYDRLLATCAFPGVPVRWLRAVAPDGLIVMPWWRPMGGGLMLAVRRGPGRSAHGRLLPLAAEVAPTRMLVTPSTAALGETAADHLKNDRYAASAWRATGFDPRDLQVDGFRALASLLVPARLLDARGPQGAGGLWLLGDDGSYACHMLNDAGEPMVIEHGPARLWGMLEDAFTTWMNLGQPARDELGVSVSPGGHTLWHGTPQGWSTPLGVTG